MDPFMIDAEDSKAASLGSLTEDEPGGGMGQPTGVPASPGVAGGVGVAVRAGGVLLGSGGNGKASMSSWILRAMKDGSGGFPEVVPTTGDGSSDSWLSVSVIEIEGVEGTGRVDTAAASPPSYVQERGGNSSLLSLLLNNPRFLNRSIALSFCLGNC